MHFTINIFKIFYDELPPLVPDHVRTAMRSALSETENFRSVDELEDMMISFGYEVWPWNQAYRKFLDNAESRMGETFLLPKLQTRVAKRYEAFKQLGGTIRDLHTGRPANFFSLEERRNLREALVKMRRELKEFTDREIMSTEQKKYLREVEHYVEVVKKLRAILEELYELAKSEEDFPMLSAEIKSRIRHFEYGLCLLGPEIDHEAAERSADFFRERKADLKHVGHLIKI